LNECQTKVLEITNILNKQNEHLLKIEVLKREVGDNLRYRESQQKVQELNEKIVELESQISQYDIETYTDNLEVLNKKKEELLNEVC